ncbi:MAG: FitA-like ribbon-helix-helix domain-containing protein [Candidatus Limnocylindria bacterium]
MSKMIQIRNVPDEVHRTLKVRAAQAGLTLSDYLLAEVQQLASLPTVVELTDRIRRRSRVRMRGSSAAAIRRHRDAS